MNRVLPPPPERFDPITARWLTPGGPLHDPQRDSVDPGHRDPVTLLGPIPRELAGLDGQGSGVERPGTGWRRRRWLLLAFVAFAVAAMLVAGALI